MNKYLKYIAVVLAFVATVTVKYESYSFFSTMSSGISVETLNHMNYFFTGVLFFMGFLFWAKKSNNAGVRTVLASLHSVIYIALMLSENSFYRFIYVNGFLGEKKQPYINFFSEQAAEFLRIGKPCYLLIMLVFAAVCFIYLIWTDDSVSEKRSKLIDDIFVTEEDIDDFYEEPEEYRSVEEAFDDDRQNMLIKLRQYCHSLEVNDENKNSLIKCLEKYDYDFIYTVLINHFSSVLTAEDMQRLKSGYFDSLDAELNIHKNSIDYLKADFEELMVKKRSEE